MSYVPSMRELDQIEMRARARLELVLERVGIQLIGERTDGDSQERGQLEQDGTADGSEPRGVDGSEPRDQSSPDTSRPTYQQS